jgi:cystathionine beta-lyase
MRASWSKPATDLIHHPYQPPAGFAAPQPGVFKASTVIFPNVAAMRARDWKHKTGYTYGLHGTPTTFQLEERIATLEGGRQCLLVPSGLAAIANVNLALLKPATRCCCPTTPTAVAQGLAEGELKNWGIRTSCYDPMNPADLEARIGPQTSWCGWRRRARSRWSSAAGAPGAHLPAARRDDRARQHLGRGPAFNGFDGFASRRQRRRHRRAGPHQVPQRRRRRAHGQHRHARRALHVR